MTGRMPKVFVALFARSPRRKSVGSFTRSANSRLAKHGQEAPDASRSGVVTHSTYAERVTAPKPTCVGGL